MANSADIKRYRQNFQGEIDAASTYRALADIEKQPQIQEVFTRMAVMEEKHAEFWAQQLETRTQQVS